MKVFSGIDTKNRVRDNWTFWAMIYPKDNVKAYRFIDFTSEFQLEHYLNTLKAKGTHGGFGMIQNAGIEERVMYV